MRKIFFILIGLLTTSEVWAQNGKRFSFATTLGTGIPVSSPKSVPATWQAIGYYNFNRRFSAGVGTGLSFYEKTLIPVFADVKFNIIKSRKFTPYIELGAGYAFAPGKNANGGMYLDPSVGIQYALRGNKRVLFAVGYQFQCLERLKGHENRYFAAEFTEHLNHGSISVRIGLLFL